MQRLHLARSLSSSRAAACSIAKSLAKANAVAESAADADASSHAEAAAPDASLSVRDSLTGAAGGPAKGAAVPAGASPPHSAEDAGLSFKVGCEEAAALDADLSVRESLTAAAGGATKGVAEPAGPAGANPPDASGDDSLSKSRLQGGCSSECGSRWPGQKRRCASRCSRCHECQLTLFCRECRPLDRSRLHGGYCAGCRPIPEGLFDSVLHRSCRDCFKPLQCGLHLAATDSNFTVSFGL